MSVFKAIRQGTREDYPFDPELARSFALAEKGLDEHERKTARIARVRLHLYPDLDEVERERLEQERDALEAKGAANLSEADQARLKELEVAETNKARAKKTGLEADLQRSLKGHIESAELRLQPSERGKLLDARSQAPPTERLQKLSVDKLAFEEKAWKELSEEERAALEFFDAALPVEPEEREQLERERTKIATKALATLDESEQEEIEADNLRRKAAESLDAEERAALLAQQDPAQEKRVQALRTKSEQSLSYEDKTVLLRWRLLVRRDEVEARALNAVERRSFDQARAALRSLEEQKRLLESAEARLSGEKRARLDRLREMLKQRRDLESLRDRADESLRPDQQEQLRRLRAQLRLSVGDRLRLERQYEQLTLGNLSGEAGTFAKGVSEREALTSANAKLAELLHVAPFNSMLDRMALEEDEAGAERLIQLLMRETRLRTYKRQGERREVIVRQGDYGGTAFLILEGRVRIMIQSDQQAVATAAARGASEIRRKGFLGLLARWLGSHRGREVREPADERYVTVHPGATPVPTVIKNFANLPAQSKEHTLGEGEVFGEIAALTRTPRTATVVPDTDEVQLLEVRWQGLRDLIKEDEDFEKYIEERYRDSSRRAYVFRIGLFASVGDTEAIRDAIRTGDLESLFREELGWRPPRESPEQSNHFQVATTPPPPLRCRMRLWWAGAETAVEIPADATRFTIGCGEGNDLRLERRPTISPEHAELRLERGRWYIHNLSRHGTIVDGQRVRTQAVLFPEARIRIGECWVLFQAAEVPAEEGEQPPPTAQVSLMAVSSLHNGIGGIKLYRSHVGAAKLPSEETCAAIAERLKRMEYLARRESRYVFVTTCDNPKEQDWRWRTPTQDAKPPDERERGGLRHRGKATPLIDELIHFLALEEIVKVTEFLSFGKFRWFERSAGEDFSGVQMTRTLDSQPIIASQGDYPNGVYMIRAGFARLTEAADQGERTVSYLRPESPHGYGLEQVIRNYLAKVESTGSGRTIQPITLPYTLRAIGYADTVFLPTTVLERFVLPSYREYDLKALLKDGREPKGLHGLRLVDDEVPVDLRDFLVDQHLVNGTQAMLINLDRCTRCDDCVRGCASSHGNNPKFVRHGKIHGNLMVANACMHCVDPVCLIDCPTGAIHRPLGGGMVLIQDETCIGCSACAHNCPYDNIRMVPIRDKREGVMTKGDGSGGVGDPQLRATKCDLCHDQSAGETACVRACPHDALRRVDLSELGSLRDIARWLR